MWVVTQEELLGGRELIGECHTFMAALLKLRNYFVEWALDIYPQINDELDELLQMIFLRISAERSNEADKSDQNHVEFKTDNHYFLIKFEQKYA